MTIRECQTCQSYEHASGLCRTIWSLSEGVEGRTGPHDYCSFWEARGASEEHQPKRTAHQKKRRSKRKAQRAARKKTRRRG